MANYDPLYDAAGKAYNVDPLLIKAHAIVESNENPLLGDDTGDGADSAGIGQFIPETAKAMGLSLQDRFVPEKAIPAMGRFIAQNLQQNTDANGNTNVRAATQRYNGSGPATEGYADKVARVYQSLQARGLNLPQQQQGTPAPVASPSPQPADPDAAAGQAYLQSLLPAAPGGVADQVLARLRQGSAPANANAPPADPDVESGQAFYRSLVPVEPAGGFDEAVGAPSVPQGAPVSPSGQRVTAMAQPNEATLGIGPGVQRALKDVTDRPAEALAAGADYVAGKLGYQTKFGPDLIAADTDDREAYNQLYGNNTGAMSGRAAGQGLLISPVLGAGNALLGAGGDVAASGLSAIAPALGNAARYAGNFLTGGLSASSNALMRGGSSVASNALTGAEASALSSGQSDASTPSQARLGAAVGGALGLAGGVASPVVNQLTGATAGVNPAVAQLAKTAQGINIKVPASALSPSPTVQVAESILSKLPGTGYATDAANNMSAFVKGVSNTFGEDTDQITPTVMKAAQGRIGGVIGDIAGKTNVAADDQLLSGLGTIEDSAKSALSDGQIKQIKNQIGNVLDAAAKGEGAIPGKTYQGLIQKGSPLDVLTGSDDTAVANYAKQIKSQLEDALDRSVPPELADQLRTARAQYKNMMTIAPLVVKGVPGEISPAALNGVVNRSFTNRAFTGADVGMQDGAPGLGTLADIGTLIKPYINSQTAERSAVLNALQGAGGAAGMLAAGNYAGPAIAAGGALATAGLTKGAAMYLRSPGYINRLIESGLNPGGVAAGGNGLISNAVPYVAPIGGTVVNGLLDSVPRRRNAQ